MAKYWLFQGEDYYPAGGIFDFSGVFDSIADAQLSLAGESDWAHIAVLESDDFSIVAYYGLRTNLGYDRKKKAYQFGPKWVLT